MISVPGCMCHGCEQARRWRRVFIVLAVLLLIASFWGCSTITPAAVENKDASFDGNEQNSGVISSGPDGYSITPHFRERYNILIAQFGGRFRPALVRDAGVTIAAERILIDREHMVKFLEMNAWAKMGRAP